MRLNVLSHVMIRRCVRSAVAILAGTVTVLAVSACAPATTPSDVRGRDALPRGYAVLERLPGHGYARLVQSGLGLRAGQRYTFSMRLLGEVRFDASDHIPNLESGVRLDGVAQEFNGTNVSYSFEDGWTHYRADVVVPFSGRFNLRLALWSRPRIVFTDVSLTDSRGNDLVRNGDFSRGLAYWVSDAFDRVSWSATPTASPDARAVVTVAPTPRSPSCLGDREVSARAGAADAIDGLRVHYERFDGAWEWLTAYEEARITLLVPIEPAVDLLAVREIACRLDASWAFFQQVTGVSPVASARTLTVAGQRVSYMRPTLAVVEHTCGAGCGFLGSYGIEIGRALWEETLENHRRGAETRALFEYEMGRNFWLFGDHLHSPRPNEQAYHLATAFATVFGHLAGVAAGSATGPGHENYDWVQTYHAAFDAYSAFPDFAQLRGGGIGNEKVQGGLWLHLGTVYGDDFFPRFFRAVLVQPRAIDLRGAVANYVTAASIAAGEDLVEWFEDELGFPTTVGLQSRVAIALRLAR